MNSPKISIIIATYNSSATLRRSLQSVKKQTFQNWECLVVDGASKDKTLDIVKEFVLKDSRFRYISEPDSGIYDAFNKGWKNARGEWIYYLGSDDVVLPDGLFNLANRITNEYVVISGNVVKKRENGSVSKWVSVGFGGCHQAKLTQRSVLVQLDGYDTHYKILADLDFYTRLNNLGYKVLNVNCDIAVFNMSGVSQNIRYLKTKTRERYSIFKKDKSKKNPLIDLIYVTLRDVGGKILHCLF